MFQRLRQLVFGPSQRSPELVEYLFVDRRRLRSYMEQLGGARTQDKLPKWTAELSLTGPKVTGEQSTTHRELTDHEMISKLRSYLSNNGYLKTGRPSHSRDVDHGPFWIERMSAAKVIFPTRGVTSVATLSELAVWVAEPARKELNGSGYSEGTFLYLLEGYWKSDEVVGTTHSGFSALNALIRELSEAAPVPVPAVGDYGDSDDYHPLGAMKRLGAQVQPSRRIESLYRLRYLTGEQVFSDWRGRRHRSNDAFGYPMYVASL